MRTQDMGSVDEILRLEIQPYKHVARESIQIDLSNNLLVQKKILLHPLRRRVLSTLGLR
jgi:hypothetical protein